MEYEIGRLSDYSDESLLKELRRVAELLGKDTMTSKEFETHGRVGVTTLIRRLGSWNNALKKAGLSIAHRQNIPNEELFVEIERLWNQLGRQPYSRDMSRLGKFSAGVYEKRFGTWIKALEKFKRWEKDESGTDSLMDMKEISPEILPVQQRKPHKAKNLEYGEPIDFSGFRHAPLNEQGVVYLFGMLSKRLGFIIEAVRTSFPDCEGKRKIPGKSGRWERVSIEFEYKSSNFKEHGHKLDECDVIVCWEDNWKDCPIEVISLKEIMKQIKKRREG